MRTDQLIQLLVADLNPVDQSSVDRALAIAVAIGAAAALSIMFVTGMRCLGANVPPRCSTSWRMVRPSGQRHREHEVRAGRCTR